MNKGKLIAGVLLLAAAAILAWYFAGGQSGQSGNSEAQHAGAPVTVTIRYGSEKKGLLHDEDFQRIMSERYGITVNGVKMGSIEMSEGSLEGVDGAWPSSELASLVFKDRNPQAVRKQQNIFNTPIVFYSWPEITDVLMQQGIVEQRENLYYVVDTRKLLELVKKGRPWKELGLKRQMGAVSVQSTDPTKSNSGFLMAGLMAVILNQGMVDEQTLPELLPQLEAIYKRMGYMENSTGILFDKYIKQGQGAFPLIAAYESLIIEFYRAYPDYQEQIQKLVRVLIPEPTVWSEHPYLALTEKGERLLEALQDPEVQALAWRLYGFRSGVMGIDNDPAILAEIGLPERIDSVTPLPPPGIMDAILQALLQ